MIEAQATDASWHQCSEAVSRADPHCRGILALGPGVAPAQMAEPFERAARHPLVKGFSADVTILSEVARAWMQDAITDADAVTHMAERYRLLCTIWDEARQSEEGEQE